MAANDFFIYGAGLQSALTGGVDLDSDTFVMVLLTSSYTPNQGTHATWADVSAFEVANGNGYASGGKVLTQAVTRSGVVVTFDANDQVWTSTSITAKYAAIVKRAGASLASSDKLLAYADLLPAGGSVSTTNGDFEVRINAAGVFTATAAST